MRTMTPTTQGNAGGAKARRAGLATLLLLLACAHAPLGQAACLDARAAGGHRTSLQEDLEHSVAVVVGKVEGATDLHRNAGDPQVVSGRIFHLRLIQLLRGSVAQVFDVRDDDDAGNFGFEVGREYLLFLDRYGPKWRIPLTDAYFVNSCGNSGPLAERSDLLRRLTGAAPTAQRLQLERAVDAWSGSKSTIHFRFALVDLNDDGIPDALVLATGPDYCGLEGCVLVVLRGNLDGSFQAISSSTVTREPIAILQERMQGWHSLTVSSGAGAVTGCQVRMAFNGSGYPENPALEACATGEQLQSSSRVTLTP